MGRMAKPKHSSSSDYGRRFTETGMQNICSNGALVLQRDLSKREEERNISKIGTWMLKPWYHKRDSVRVSWGLEISRCIHSLALKHHDPVYPTLKNDSILNPVRLSVGYFGLKLMDRSLFSLPSLLDLGISHFLSNISSNFTFSGKPFLTSWVGPVPPPWLH